MDEWLYGANGYYTKYKQIGKKGDFYTSVSTSKFFGGCIAKHIIKVIDEGYLPENTLICEIGAHHGYLLADIVEFIYTLRPQLLDTLRFGMVERQEKLREFQKNYFLESFGDAVNLEHFEDISKMDEEHAFFVANEIFDAFACELLYKGKIARVENHKIHFDIEDKWVLNKAKKYHKEKGEIAIGYEEFASSMVNSVKRFEFLTFDYGEMQARVDFSIRIYKEHEVFPFFEDGLNREELFGKTDITYDVTFAHVKDAFEDAGANMVEYKTQMAALVEMGILELLEMLEKNADQKIYKQEVEKVKTLIMPQFLGERFKMIRFRK
jgi:SAM-dependent MidA family methyltransferase